MLPWLDERVAVTLPDAAWLGLCERDWETDAVRKPDAVPLEVPELFWLAVDVRVGVAVWLVLVVALGVTVGDVA